MIQAALYLSQRSFVNALRRRIQRLRQPKYLVGFLIGLGYFYWILVRPGSARGGSPLVPSPLKRRSPFSSPSPISSSPRRSRAAR